ncbi:MAG: DUF2804 domain-containing protein [Anaerolineales bacterium]|nr:DUF2804 domain-containing protein [Anaerolineales bacterium]
MCAVFDERELTDPVDLCTPQGLLNPQAVGWARQPVITANLRGRWLAKKRWNYWAVTTKTHLFSVTISNEDYIGMVFLYFGDFQTGVIKEKTIITLFGSGVHMPTGVMETVNFQNKAADIRLQQADQGVQIRVSVPDFEGEQLAASFDILYPADHDTLNVVIPWDERTFQYTAKHNTLPAQGSVRIGQQEVLFEGQNSFACLDFGRGIWPRRCAWNWGSASGWEGGHVVGLNLGGQWTDGTGMTENALCIDGRLTKISEDLRWEYDRADYNAPWKISTPQSDQISLTFTPFLERCAATKVGPLESEVHQMFGRYQGTLHPEGGDMLKIEDLIGWAEDHKAVW